MHTTITTTTIPPPPLFTLLPGHTTHSRSLSHTSKETICLALPNRYIQMVYDQHRAELRGQGSRRPELWRHDRTQPLRFMINIKPSYAGKVGAITNVYEAVLEAEVDKSMLPSQFGGSLPASCFPTG